VSAFDHQAAGGNTLPFRRAYIIFPAAVLLTCVVLAAVFYPQLAEPVAYHFTGGEPDRWLSRGAIISWLLVPQFVFTLLGWLLARGLLLFSARFRQAENPAVRTLLLLVGNMVALPQLILGFAMLSVFSYNVYQVQFIPLWLFAALVMLVGVIVLGVFFLKAFRQSRAAVAVPRSKK